MIEDDASVLPVFHHLLCQVKVLCPLSSCFCCQHVSRLFDQVVDPNNMVLVS